MNLVVCLKRVPDTETRIRIDSSGTGIDPSGVKYVISPYDEFAVELALRTKEAEGSGEVMLLSLGDSASQEMLRKGLAMGADRATLLTGAPDMDGLATAKSLAAELEGLDIPVVLFGVKAIDDDQQQVGPMVAVLMGRACVTGVSSFEVRDGKAVCQREVEGGTEVVEATLPVVLTITKGEHEPRLASLKGIMAAKKKPLDEKPSHPAPSRVRVRSLREPAARPPGRIVGEGPEAVAELVRLLRNEAKVI